MSRKNRDVLNMPIGHTELEADFKEYIDGADRYRFSYPKNWFVQEAIWDTDVRAVTANSPEGYFWILASYPESIDLMSTAKSVLELMKGEYNHLEETPLERRIAGYVLSGFEMNFYYLDLVNNASVLALKKNGRSWIIFHQGTDMLKLLGEKFSCGDVFDAITYSFLTSISERAERDQAERNQAVGR
ncbi:MAG: hypothetical protein IJG83_08950 [Thermoguttaceae bacterium]|nr:hypothetical protein [Thermoguttaceae bacterium]MBQ6619255.1 hypothetical protein [Thermoguttaceae bacterium]